MRDVEMGQHRALGIARGARGVQDACAIVFTDARHRHAGYAATATTGQFVQGARRLAHAQAGRGAGIGDAVFEHIVIDDAGRAALLHDPRQARTLFTHADRHRDHAQLLQREQHTDELRAVRQEHHHAFAAAQAFGREAGREAVHFISELAVGPAPAFAAEGLTVRCQRRAARQHRVERRRPLDEAAQLATEMFLLLHRGQGQVRFPADAGAACRHVRHRGQGQVRFPADAGAACRHVSAHWRHARSALLRRAACANG